MGKIFTNSLFILVVLLTGTYGFGQGCVAIRGMSSCNGNIGAGLMLKKGESFIGTDYRYFKSFRHFRGAEEEEYRLD